MNLSFPLGRLRPLSEGDVPALARLLDDRSIWRNLRDRLPSPYGEQDARNFLTSLEHDTGSEVAGIEVEGRLCGAIGLHRMQDVYRSTVEVGFWVGREFQGRGIASAAVPVFVAHAFARWPEVVRVEAQVFAWNAASQRVLERCGFTFEGRLRQAVTKDGSITDLLVYSVVRSDRESVD